MKQAPLKQEAEVSAVSKGQRRIGRSQIQARKDYSSITKVNSTHEQMPAILKFSLEEAPFPRF